MKAATITTVRITTRLESRSSARLGQLIFEDSTWTSLMNSRVCVVQAMGSNSSSSTARPASTAVLDLPSPRCRGASRPPPKLAGLEGFEPPTPGFGDRCSSQAELQACLAVSGTAPECFLPRLLVRRVLPAEPAVLAELDPIRVEPLVLLGDVVAILAVVAGQRNLVPHGRAPVARR